MAIERTTSGRKTLRIAALGDIHVSKTSAGAFHALFTQISETADVLVLCGDFTDYGLPDEARILARELTSAMKLPVIAVLGNHDYEGDAAGQIAELWILGAFVMARSCRRAASETGAGSAVQNGVL